MKYKDGDMKIVVTSNVPILRHEVGDKSQLKRGAAIAVAVAAKRPDGTFEAARIMLAATVSCRIYQTDPQRIVRAAPMVRADVFGRRRRAVDFRLS
jgi:hypothetical protein